MLHTFDIGQTLAQYIGPACSFWVHIIFWVVAVFRIHSPSAFQSKSGFDFNGALRTYFNKKLDIYLHKCYINVYILHFCHIAFFTQMLYKCLYFAFLSHSY